MTPYSNYFIIFNELCSFDLSLIIAIHVFTPTKMDQWKSGPPKHFDIMKPFIYKPHQPIITPILVVRGRKMDICNMLPSSPCEHQGCWKILKTKTMCFILP